MGEAEANVAQQFEGQRQAAQRQLEGFGISPSSTRYAALDLGARTAQAAAQAAAGTQAAERTEMVGRALRSEALNIGKGYPGQVNQSYAGAISAGSSASDASQKGFATGAQAMGNPTAWMGANNQAIGNWGSALNMGYDNALAGWKAEQGASSGWGGALGMVGGLASKMFFEEGGDVPDPEMATPGGAIPTDASPTGGKAVDDVPAVLTAGEFVVPRDVAQWLGEEKLQKLIEKARQDKAGAGAKPEAKAAPASSPTFHSRPQALPTGAIA